MPMVEPAIPVRIYALGGFRLLVDGRELRLRTRKEATLLLRLSLAGDGGVTRDECIAMLWPETSEARARHSLSEALRGIEQATRVEVARSPERLRLEEGAVAIDAHELDQAIATGDIEAAARLWVSGFLAGWYPPTPEASHWVDAYGALLANNLERATRTQLASRRQATDSRGVSACVALLERLGVATDADREAAAEAEQITGWESLRPGESIQPRIPIDREGPFVGRVEEMKILTAELERALAGELRVVLVSGEAGIGKTRTCQRLARLAALRGARLFMSKCYELEQSVPFGALGEAFKGSVTPSDLAPLKPLWREVLGAALPSLNAEAPDQALVRSDPIQYLNGQAINAAFASLLSSVCASKPGFLFIDDLQWADATSCQIIHYLMRAAEPKGGLCLLLSFRREALAANGSARALAKAAEIAGATALSLKPMPEPDIRLQLEKIWAAPSHKLDTVANVSGGNPFFARELAMADANSVSTGSFESVSNVILSRAESLTEQERLVLDVAAVAGSPISVRDLALTTDLSVPKVVRALMSLARLRLTAEQNGNVLIAHDLTRQAFYSSLPESAKRSLHAAVAMSVENAAPAFMAHHYAAAGMDKEACAHALAAAEESRSRRAFMEEVEWLLLAFQTDHGDRLPLLELVVNRLFALARYSEALGLIESSGDAHHPNLASKAALARLKALSSSSPEFDGAMEDCDAIFGQAVAAGRGFEAIEALREKMRFAQERADIDSMLEIAEQLHEFGCTSADPALRAHAVAISLMKLSTVHPEVVRDRYEALLASIDEAMPDRTRASIGMVDALDLYNQGRIADAGLRFHKLIRRTRAIGDLGEEVRFRSLLVPISTEAGRFSRSMRHGEFVLAYSRLADARWERLMTLLNLAACRLEAGDFSRCRSLALEGLSAAKEYPSWLLTEHTAFAVLGLCAFEQSDYREAANYAARIEEQLPPAERWLGDVSQIVVLLTRMRVHRRRLNEAEAFLGSALTHRRAPRVYEWTLVLEGARLGLGDREKSESQTVSIRNAAKATGCRLIQLKAESVLKGT